MKTYWDLEEKERAALTRDQVNDYLKFELMQRGVTAAVEPTLEAEDPPDIDNITMYRVTYAGQWGRDHFDCLFYVRASAEAMIASKPMAIDNISGTQVICEPHELAVESVDMPLKAMVVEVQSRLSEYKAAKERNRKAQDEYTKAAKEAEDACEGIWTDWYDCISKERNRQRIRDTFSEYRVMAGDENIARQFLNKTFTSESVEDALGPWVNVA